MPRHLHLDYETFSKVDLKRVGAYRYGFDPSTEILCAAMAINKEEPRIWHPGLSSRAVGELDRHFDALEDPETLIYAHNAEFEMAISQGVLERDMGIKCPDLSRFRCTMSMARRACLPSGLDLLATVLELDEGKDKRGKALIKLFSQMQAPKKPTKALPQGLPERRVYPQDEPEEFAAFMQYCMQDVRVEQQVAEKLAYFDDPLNNATYTATAIINARGVPVNLDALCHAQNLIEEETPIVNAKFRAITGLDYSQDQAIRHWCNRNGYDLPNMQAETIEALLDEFEGESDVDDVITALRLRATVKYASIAKIPTMIGCAGPHDNRIRGMLNHYGATTGRWTASLVQFQNMKRPAEQWGKETFKGSGITLSERAYRHICQGMSLEMIRFLYGPPLEVISSCIRHFVEDVELN